MRDEVDSMSMAPAEPPFIVVGVDGSEGSRAALRFACAEARLRGAAVHVVHAWWALPELDREIAGRGADWQNPGDQDAKRVIEVFCVDALGDLLGDLDVTALPAQGVAASAALLEAAKGAELLVVGSRGAGGFRRLLLGSVSQQCIHHAECPVAVVPPAERVDD